MPSHTTKVEFRGVEYTETTGFNPHGQEDGVITWGQQGKQPQIVDYYDPTDLTSVDRARDRIKDFLKDEIPRSEYGWNPTDPTNVPTGNMPDLDGPGSP